MGDVAIRWNGFLKQLKYVEQLKVLDISENEFNGDEAALFANSIRECRSLERLNLAGCLVNVPLYQMVQALKECKALKSLNLSRCLSKPVHNLQSKLLIHSSDISAGEMLDDVVDLLQSHSSLEELDLSYNDLNSIDVQDINNTLYENPTLTSLSLEGNCIGNEGLLALFDILAANDTLKSLNVFGMTFEREGFEDILNLFKKNSSICALRIILPDEVEALHEVIEDHIELNLKRLHFANGHEDSMLSTKLKLKELKLQEEAAQRKKTKIERQISTLKHSIQSHQEKLKAWDLRMKNEPICTWNHETVMQFLHEIDLGDYCDYFQENKEFDGQMLLQMNSLYLRGANLMFEQSKRLQSALFLINHFKKLSDPPEIFEWTNERVLSWLEEKGFADLTDKFKVSHEILISGKEFLFLDHYDLVERLHLDPKQAPKVEVAIANLRQSLIEAKVPDHFTCSITYELMKDPVIASDGHVYERKAIEDWLKNNDRSPLTNQPLIDKKVYPCQFLKNSIAEYLAKKSTK